MLNKNIDGIKKINHTATPKRAKSLVKNKIDGITRKRITQAVVRSEVKNVSPARVSYAVPYYIKENTTPNFSRVFFQKIYSSRVLPLIAIVVALVVAFSGGMWAALNTPKTEALDRVEASSSDVNYQVTLASGAVAGDTQINNDVLFNTPIEYLKNYFESTSEPDIIKLRTEQLKEFLKGRDSPLESEAETIAQQPHWKLILAIAFAESTLGKHCYEFNCSGIGGSKIKTYSSSKQWIIDFNRLLEKRYKGDTLEEMCGVYVQPCNPNWLLATQQI